MFTVHMIITIPSPERIWSPAWEAHAAVRDHMAGGLTGLRGVGDGLKEAATCDQCDLWTHGAASELSCTSIPLRVWVHIFGTEKLGKRPG